MKKSLLLIFTAALALGGALAFHSAEAQTKCPDVKINVANFNTKSNPIQKQFADCGKPKSVTLTKSGEIRSCKDITLVVQALPDWSWDEATKTFKIWLVNNYNAKFCSTPGIVHWVVGYTLSWGGGVSTPEPTYTGYYCDRTDPAKPTCQATTNSQITDTEYQCSLSCWPEGYQIEISRRLTADDSFDPFSSTVGDEYGVGEPITFQAEATPQNNTAALGCANWSWDFGDGTKEGGQACGPTNERSHSYATPGIYTVTARVYSNTSANEVLRYPGFVDTTEVIITKPCVKPKGSKTNFNNILEDLDDYQPVKIAADSFEQWVSDNLPRIIYKMGEAQCKMVETVPEEKVEKVSIRTIKGIKKYTDANLPYPLSLLKIKPALDEDERVGHQLIALDVKEIKLNKIYQIKVIDPNGPEIKNLRCKTSRQFVKYYYNQEIIGMFCDLGGDFGLGLPMSIPYDLSIMDSLLIAKNSYCQDNSQSAFCLERQNLSRWLEGNHTKIGNSTLPSMEGAALGLCWGWSDFNLKMAYLADFVGKCEGDKVTKNDSWFFQSLTAVATRPWVELLLNFVRQ